MSSRQKMTMRADVQVDSTSDINGYGHDAAANWLSHPDSPIACHVYSEKRRQITDGNKIAVVEDIKCIIPLSFGSGANAVTELDRVSSITDRLGNILFYGPMSIVTIQRRKCHIELTLDRSKS